MKHLLLFVIGFGVLVIFNPVYSQNEVAHPSKVSTAIYFDELPSLKDLPPVDDQYYIDNFGKSVAEGLENEHEEETDYSNWKNEGPDPVWQKKNGWIQNNSKSLIQNFAGQSSPYLPSDCNGTVGPNHFMQTVNTTYAIYNKTGAQVVAPTAMNTLFSGVTGASNNDGDPLILYDEQAQKWVAVEFSISGSPDYMLVAVSQTNDPTGSWWRWSFVMNGMPDYEKMGIWHDGYYMGTNNGSTSGTGDDVYVFERNVMITGGASPQLVQFHNPNRPFSSFHAIMPLDADGSSAPASSPGQFITINDNAWGGTDQIWIYECAINWTTTSSSTFTRTQQIAVPSFDSQFNSWGTGDIAQLGTTQLLDAQPYVLMVRGQYKNWGTTQSIVCLHTVDVDGTNHAGERWYELEKTSQTDLTWSIRQSGTYAPDTHSRWMGSIAINDNHEIAIGYSISSSSMSPNIRYCGQSAFANSVASGIMDIAESANMVSSPQSQGTGSYRNRWGDYSLMTIDPIDGTTFWFTNEYYSSGKKTRIMSFTLNAPVLTADFSATPTNVNVGNTATFTDASFSPNTLNSWSWSFPGGTPSTAVGQGPHIITYSSTGTFDASLTVTDVASGSNSLTKTNYIHVFDCTISAFPWTEGFENGGNIPNCWSNEFVSGTQNWAYQAGGYSSHPSGAHTGSYNAYLFNPAFSSNVTKLVTPQLRLAPFSSATLTFWHTQAYWPNDQDELRVYYKTSSAGAWNLLATYTNNIAAWTLETINIPALSNDYYIAFEGTAKYGYGVCVDDVSVSVGPELAILWIGTSSDWNTGNNWSGGNVPTATDDITVPAAPSGGNFPETNSGSGAVCKNITIESGAHVFIPSNNSLTVSGTLTNNSGNTGLIVKSDATGTGSLIHTTTNVNCTVERYLTDGRWHFIGMPVSNAFAGVFHLPSGHSSIYLRTHITSTNSWDNFIVPVTTPLQLGRGYEVWVGTPSGFSQPETVEFPGLLNTGNYTTGSGNFYGLQYTSGHGLNLISNPYPSALQANIGSWSKTNIDNSIWTWSDAAGNYVYWNGTENPVGSGWGTLTGGVIPAMQGFFVLANNSNPSLTIPQADRIHSSQAYYKNSNSGIPNTLRLDVTGNNYHDAIFVSFKPEATENYDELYDVKKLFGLPDAPQLYSMIPGEQLSINALPELNGYQLVQLGFECESNGDFTIEASELESFTDYVPVYLEDTKEGVLQKLNDLPQYDFTYNTGDEIGRFLLHFEMITGLNEIGADHIHIYSNKNRVYIQSDKLLEGEVSVFDMLGQKIFSQEAKGENLVQFIINKGTGYYLVKVQTSEGVLTGKVFIK